MKPYSRIAAIAEAFKVVNTNVLEAEQRKQLQAIRAHLDSLEDGSAQVRLSTFRPRIPKGILLIPLGLARASFVRGPQVSSYV